MRNLFSVAMGVGFLISGCTIHPVPFDVPGYRTIDIVKKIRCEAKQALDKFAQQDDLKKNIYDKMRIGYKFTFTITENNNLGAGANLKMPVSTGTFTLGVSGGKERERLGIRDFTFVDTFREARAEKACAGPVATKENFAYPITGVIGLEEVIRTFLELQAIGLGELPPVEFTLPPRDAPGAPRKAPKKASGAPSFTEEFVETFEFTTTVKGGVSPKVELKPLGSGLSLSQASGDLSASRIDKHAVIITLAPNYAKAINSLAAQDIGTRLRRIENFTRFVPIQ